MSSVITYNGQDNLVDGVYQSYNLFLGSHIETMVQIGIKFYHTVECTWTKLCKQYYNYISRIDGNIDKNQI